MRAIAILLVLYGHARQTTGFPESLRWIARLGDVAELGVRVFFVISGYLITSLLVAERRKTGTIKLGSFYARRAFRIFPAYYFYLAAVAVLASFGVVELPARDLLLAATYLVNFWVRRAWVVGHAWSLSVEEQFYLIWPAVFRASGERRGLSVALAVIASGPVIRVVWALLLRSEDQRNMIAEVFPTLADSLATGCALTLLAPRLSANERYLRWLRSPALLAGLALMLVFSTWFGTNHPWAQWLALASAANIGAALLVDRYVRYPDGPIGKILNWKPLAFIGTISYSLYLWQQVFLPYPKVVKDVRWWGCFPQNIVFSAAAALASYYLIEKPSLRLRDRVLRGNRPLLPQPSSIPAVDNRVQQPPSV